MSNFSNKRVWLITGCSSGFGRELVEAVLATGDRVVATLRKPAVLESFAKEYTKEQLLVLPLDVTNNTQIDETFDAVKKTFGRLDVVVNNAGYGLIGEVEGIEESKARHQMDVLFWGAVNMTKKAVGFYREVNPPGHGGRILQISSIGGFVGFPGGAFYHAGKFALEGFTEAMQKELIPEWNIKMTLIEPGGFRTEYAKGSLNVVPMHPAYEKSSTAILRSYIRSFTPKGDPAKAAQAMIRVVNMDDPPMRIPLGTDAISMMKGKLKSMSEEVEKHEEIGISCLADDAEEDMSEFASL